MQAGHLVMRHTAEPADAVARRAARDAPDQILAVLAGAGDGQRVVAAVGDAGCSSVSMASGTFF